MNSTTEKRIALISVFGDPAIEIGKKEAGGQNVNAHQVGEALSQLGWHVDIFSWRVSADQEMIVQHNPLCRTIRLTVEFVVPPDNCFQYLPEFVVQLSKFQQENNIQYDFVYPAYWLSSWVKMELEQIQGSKQFHTYHSLGIVKYNTMKNISLITAQHLAVKQEALEIAVRILISLYSNQIDSSVTRIEKKLDVHQEMKPIKKNHTLKARFIGAFKSGGVEALKELIDNPVFNVLIATVKGWQNPDVND